MLQKCSSAALCLMLLLFSLGSTETGIAQPAQASGAEIAVAKVVRQRMGEFESAWNRGDIAAVTSQYDRSMFAIFQSEYMDYKKYVAAVVTSMSKPDRQHMRLHVENVRSLGADYAVADGRVYMTAQGGTEQSAPFTVIYMRTEGQWKFIYAHS